MIKNILKLLYLAMLNLFNFLSHLAQTFTNYVPVYFCLNINMRVYAIYTSKTMRLSYVGYRIHDDEKRVTLIKILSNIRPYRQIRILYIADLNYLNEYIYI